VVLGQITRGLTLETVLRQGYVRMAAATDSPVSTLRRRLLVDGIAQGMTMTDAAEYAHYSDRQAAREAFVDMTSRLASVMDDVGLGERDILCRVREMVDADKTHVISTPAGIVKVDAPDNSARLKAIEIAAKMRGMVDRRDDGPRIGTVNINWNGSPNWMDHNVIDSPTNDNERVNGLQGTSTVEGTGSDPGLPTHTHSVKNGEGDGINTVKCSGSGRGDDQNNTLKSRVKKKRGPRLPVYKGRRK
jgi:hypothetical protein